MSYAINATNDGWRAVNSSADLLPGETFSASTPVLVPTLAQAKTAQIVTINGACQTALDTITSPYPPAEISTWPQQYAEALAYNTSSTALTPMLSAIATASGQTVAALAASVIAKAAAYQAASGAAVGKRQALTAAINAATTVTSVQGIVW